MSGIHNIDVTVNPGESTPIKAFRCYKCSCLYLVDHYDDSHMFVLDNKVYCASCMPQTFKSGSRFKVGEWGEHILAQVLAQQFCLIGLRDGNRFTDPIVVKNNCSITREEINLMSGSSYAEPI